MGKKERDEMAALFDRVQALGSDATRAYCCFAYGYMMNAATESDIESLTEQVEKMEKAAK